MEPAIILFSFLIVVGIVGIAILRYQDWKYKKHHPEEQEEKKPEPLNTVPASLFFLTPNYRSL